MGQARECGNIAERAGRRLLTARTIVIVTWPESGPSRSRRLFLDWVFMARRDWDKDRRKNLVDLHGSEPSEYPDITEQIATAKGRAKQQLHGPSMQQCANCAHYFSANAYLEHIRHCQPRRKPRMVTCRKCGVEIEPAHLVAHLRRYHSKPLKLGCAKWPSKGIAPTCPVCGRSLTRSEAFQHIVACRCRRASA